jgi:hypothetical protein
MYCCNPLHRSMRAALEWLSSERSPSHLERALRERMIGDEIRGARHARFLQLLALREREADIERGTRCIASRKVLADDVEGNGIDAFA